MHTDELIHRSLYAMGCRFELILDPEDSPHDVYSMEAIADEMVELIHDWHNRLSVFIPTSLVSRINTTPSGVPVRVDRDFFDLLRLCDSLRVHTDGAFNIAAGTLMHMHGFRDRSDPCGMPAIPDLRHAYTLDTEDLTITRDHDHIKIDFGAIAKGFVLDRLADELREYGIRRAFIHGGSSSVLGFGNQNGTRPWRVLVSDSPDLHATLCAISLGISEHSGRVNADNRGHIMDPRTGMPAENRVRRVVCAHPSAATADAFSTALSVRPDLIDQLFEHGCSIAIFSTIAEQHHADIRDPLGVFSGPMTTDPLESIETCIVQGPLHV